MKNINQLHLLTHVFLSFFTLCISYIQSAQQTSEQKYVTLNFWSKKGDNEEKPLKSNEYQKLAKAIKDGQGVNEYQKRSYSVKENSPVFPTLLQLVEDLNIPSITSWRDLRLTALYLEADWEDKSAKPPFFYYFYKRATPGGNMDVIIGEKEGNQTEKVKLILNDNGKKMLEEEIVADQDMTIDDIECLLQHDSSMSKEIESEIAKDIQEGLYFPKAELNSESALNPHEVFSKKVKDLSSKEIIFSKKKCLCKFYINKNGSLLSQEDTNTPEKIKQGIEGEEWKFIEKTLYLGEFLFPVVDNLLPGISAMDIQFKHVTQNNDTYKLFPVIHQRGSQSAQPTTVSIRQVNEPFTFVLLENEKESEANIQCILKKEGDPSVQYSQEISISQPTDGQGTYFQEVYLHLLSSCGYRIEPTSVYTPKITYKSRGNNNQSEEVLTLFDSIFEHNQNHNVESYTFIMPEKTRPTKDGPTKQPQPIMITPKIMVHENETTDNNNGELPNSSNNIFNNHNGDNNVLKYIIVFIIGAGVSMLGSLIINNYPKKRSQQGRSKYMNKWNA